MIFSSHTYVSKGIVWFITKEELPKKIRNGKFKFWIAETFDKKHGLRGDSLKDTKEKVDNFVYPEN